MNEENVLESTPSNVVAGADVAKSPGIVVFDETVKMMSLADYPKATPQDKDPDVLILGPALERTGTLLLVAPAGVGKSVMVDQFAPMFRAGLPFAGLTPTRNLDIWVIQFEDSSRRLATDRDDIKAHLESAHPKVDWDQVFATTMFPCFPPVKGAKFLDLLDKTLGNAKAGGHLPDAICINPIFSVVNGDISSATNCTPFLRGGTLDTTETIGLQGILKKYDIGCILVHHTGKPPTTKTELANWINSPNPEYQACGSSELVNFARTCLTMMKIPKHDGIVKISAGKNGGGLEWPHGIHVLAYGEGLSCSGRGRAHYFRDPRPDEMPTDSELGISSENKKPGPRQGGNAATDARYLAEVARSSPVIQKALREEAEKKFGGEAGKRAFDYLSDHLDEFKLVRMPCGINNAQMIGDDPERILVRIKEYCQQMKTRKLNTPKLPSVCGCSEDALNPNTDKANG